MEKFEQMQTFALSWALLFFLAIFVGVVVWAFWPSNRKGQRDAAQSIFRNEDRPAQSDGRA